MPGWTKIVKTTSKPPRVPAPSANERQPPLFDLYPPIAPYSSGFLAVDDTHNLYWEQSGNPDGVPIVLLHGGPGAGATPTHRRFFDPAHYRIIIFDQRGAGRSTPLGCTQDNTLPHLVDDIEKLRTRLNIERWHIFGGSWGSTLAMAYAAAHPKRCISLILRGIFLMEADEVEWFLYGMRMIFPEAWERFVSIIPEHERGDLLNAYYKRLNGDDKVAQMEAALRWALYEGSCASLLPHHETLTSDDQRNHALALALLECHYFKHNVIPPDQSLMKSIPVLRNIPTTIVHGRYDVICPIRKAYDLHLLWPEADYVVVPDGGHSAMDPAIRSRLIEAVEHAKTLR
jgi:proline iminopeptidase